MKNWQKGSESGDRKTPDFFMFLSQALDSINEFSPEQFSSLYEYLSPELISECLEVTGNVTIRNRRLPLETMVWCVLGMALFRHIPMNQIVNQLDIILCFQEKDLLLPHAL